MPSEHALVTVPDLFEPGRYGLTSVVNWIAPTDTHWQGGIQYDADCTEVAVTIMECISGAPSPIPAKGRTWSRLVRGARPFTVYDEIDCTPDANWWDVGETRALRALANSGPMQVERTFQLGTTAVTGGGAPLIYPNLTSTGPIFASDGHILLQPASTIVSGAPVDVVEGLGILEKALGLCWDGTGVIHVPLRLASAFAARNLCYRDGNYLRTYGGGNKVVIGSGYDETKGPQGVTAPVGAGWIWGTTPIFGIKSSPRAFPGVEAFDRNVNTYKVIAEQTFILGWTCCLIAVLVTVGGELAGLPGTAQQQT